MSQPPHILSKHNQPLIASAKNLWQKNEKFLAAEFFLSGFIFDIVTLQRIDDQLTIVQQGLFLVLILIFLILKTIAWNPPSHWPSWGLKAWSFHVEALHFLFGSLLSGFMVFYFKSSSVFTSAGFLLVLLILLVANEFQRFKDLELPFKWALCSLCLVSFLSFLMPILLGFVGISTFILSMIAAILVLAPIFVFLKKRLEPGVFLRNQMAIPSLAVLGTFAMAYWLQIIPPVPLSLKYIGIFHQVQRDKSGKYQLFHQKPWWNIWHNGDQNFYASPNDKVFCYFRLFSPTRFKDEIFLHWFKKNPQRGWESQDKIPLQVTGGREDGFRGFGSKANYSAGTWKVQVETTEGREVGRIYFEIIPVPGTEPSQFSIETQ